MCIFSTAWGSCSVLHSSEAHTRTFGERGSDGRVADVCVQVEDRQRAYDELLEANVTSKAAAQDLRSVIPHPFSCSSLTVIAVSNFTLCLARWLRSLANVLRPLMLSLMRGG